MSPFPFVPRAYIDPGTGSMLIQVIIGTILALPFFLRSQVGRVFRAFFDRKPKRRSDGGSEPATLED